MTCRPGRAALTRLKKTGSLLLLLLAPAAAHSQVGGSVVAETDYRFRGVSLSSQRPDLRLTLAYDHPGGAYATYAGLSATTVEFEPEGRRASLLGYAGFTGSVGPAGHGWRWDAGLTYTRTAGESRYDYGEVHAGLLGEHASLRLYLSPDYFGSGAATAYLELDAGWLLAPPWRLFAHLGSLQRLDGGEGRRIDTRLGAGLRAGELELQLAWVSNWRDGLYPVAYEQRRSTLVFSASVAF